MKNVTLNFLRGLIGVTLLSINGHRALANHGPGTSGGGSSTASGETLKANTWDLSFRFDYTGFEHISQAEAERRAIQSGGFDAISRSVIASTSLTYGITDDFQASASWGYYWGDNFIDAASDGMGGAESGTTDPNGLTDLWLNAKWRVMKGAPGNLSLIGGVKFPVGKDDVRLSNGELLEPSSQPDSGAFDFQAGVAYSRFLTSKLTIDASAVYTFRTEHEGFKVGDRLDLGAALAYRLTDDIKAFPNVSVFGEVLGVILQKDDDHGDLNPNSGGAAMYLSPGVRVRFDPKVALTFAMAFPVLQNLDGDQIKSQYIIAMTLSFSF